MMHLLRRNLIRDEYHWTGGTNYSRQYDGGNVTKLVLQRRNYLDVRYGDHIVTV